MPTTNDFLPFAVGAGANVLSQSDYAALAALTSGFQAGTAISSQLNKVWRQSSIMSAVLAQFIVNNSGQSAADDGTTATLLANFTGAVHALTRQQVVLADTGAANAYTAANATPLVAGTWIDGVVQAVKIAHANTGASTYAPDGLTAIPIYGLGLQALQGGELAIGGTAVLMHATIPGVNSGNPICVLMECAGGAQQIAPGTQSQHAAQIGQVGHGQCRLSYVGATQLKLMPYNGHNLIINGVPQQIPAAGVSATNAGLAASTLYYLYMYSNAGVMTPEFSTTTHATDPNSGVEIKSGDASRTLVGMIYTNASSQFVDSPSAGRCVLSYFNRVGKEVSQRILLPASTTSAGSTIISTALNCPFLTWGDEYVMCSADGGVRGSNVNATMYTGHCFDGNLSGELNGTYVQAGVVNYDYPVALSLYKVGLSEGYHYSTLLGNVTGGYTATWAANSLYNRALIRG